MPHRSIHFSVQVVRTMLHASFLLILAGVSFGLASVPGKHLVAQDVRMRKPLPKFLRSATLADRYLSTRDVDELLQFERVEPVCLQLIKRPAVPRHARVEALRQLSEMRSTDGATELLPWIEFWDDSDAVAGSSENNVSGDADRVAVLNDLAGLLPEQPRAALERQRDRLLRLATEGRFSPTRQGALIALIQADADPSAAWQVAADRPTGRVELLQGLSWLPSEAPRAALYQRIRPLVEDASSPNDVRQAAIESIGLLDVQPRETFEILAKFVDQDVFPAACVPSLCNISREHWTAEFRQPLAAGLIRLVSSTPLAERTSPESKQAIKLVQALAELLPSDDAAALLRQLAGATVKEITIRALEEKMAYDQTVIVVQAGQGVQIHFINDDIMPHNLVVVDSPAAREEVGIAADRMQNEPDALARGYLPASEHLLHATRLLYPQQVAELTFTAPPTPGVYAYLCTFPGHWIKMYGALVVSEDTATYLADNRPLPSADELLGIRTVEWKWDELVGELTKLPQGRSFENGQKNFLKASCFACHQIGNEGGRIGPELTKIREKHKTPTELLRQIMMPSEKVEPNYATVVVETTGGQVIRGVLIGETETELHISENPLASCEPKIVPKDEIEDLTRSQLSPMPEQLLNTLTDIRDVLDLLAYVFAGGDPQDPLFH